ncbi:MAG: amino acid ABC transporter substrate-binding protein, partial [Firmicutes bacterium]|nr:amino acid ABC transporter substrate-binding protein [Bacillota bacterium]
MTMKRFLALFLAVCMTLTLAACGGGSSAPADTATAPASTGSTPAPAATTGSAPAASGAKTVSV